MGQGFNQLKGLIQSLWIEGRKPLYAIAEHTLGRIYLQIILKEGEPKCDRYGSGISAS